MTTTPFGAVLVMWLVMMLSPFWLRNVALRVLGCISLAATLSFFNFPDIIEYEMHYQKLSQATTNTFLIVKSEWNFEIGYDLLVFISSKFLSFGFFYILIIALSLLSYYRFYNAYIKDAADLCFVLFVSLFIYYISFTLRTTIASALLANMLVAIKKNKTNLSIVLIAAACFVHSVAIPFISLLSVSTFDGKNLPKITLALLAVIFSYLMAEIAVPVLSTLFLNKEFVDFKIESYSDLAKFNWNLLVIAWILIGISLLSLKKIREEDFWIYTSVSSVFALLSFNVFFQGRATWTITFIYSYLIVSMAGRDIKCKDLMVIICLIVSVGTLGVVRY